MLEMHLLPQTALIDILTKKLSLCRAPEVKGHKSHSHRGLKILTGKQRKSHRKVMSNKRYNEKFCIHRNIIKHSKIK